jgi:hypothetical protein
MGLAGRAIVCAQIKARFLRFDPGQHQPSAALGTGRPESVDKLEIKRIRSCHSTASIFAGGIIAECPFRRGQGPPKPGRATNFS